MTEPAGRTGDAAAAARRRRTPARGAHRRRSRTPGRCSRCSPSRTPWPGCAAARAWSAGAWRPRSAPAGSHRFADAARLVGRPVRLRHVRDEVACPAPAWSASAPSASPTTPATACSSSREVVVGRRGDVAWVTTIGVRRDPADPARGPRPPTRRPGRRRVRRRRAVRGRVGDGGRRGGAADQRG